MRMVVVVQARMGSTRLPGKVLLPLAGVPLLQRMLERVLAAAEPDEVTVATTTAAADEPIRELARHLQLRVVSGHPTDLLDRHLLAAREARADVMVKVPSDCPLIDPDVIDQVIARFRAVSAEVDFVTNLHPPTWPDGNDVDVVLDQAPTHAVPARAFARWRSTTTDGASPTTSRRIVTSAPCVRLATSLGLRVVNVNVNVSGRRADGGPDREVP